MSTRNAAPGWDAFLSHASEDDALATRVRERLVGARLSVWVDHQDLGRKGVLLEALQTVIEHSRHVVVLWSKDSAGSRYVTAEWNFAWNRDLPIVPCRLDPTLLPLGLAGRVYCDFRASFETGAAQLCDALKTTVAAGSSGAQAPTQGDAAVVAVAVQQNALFKSRGQREPAGTLRLNLGPHTGATQKQLRGADSGTAIARISAQQNSLLNALGRGDAPLARKIQLKLDPLVDAAAGKFPGDPDVLSLAGYHLKNAYQLKHWGAIQARRPPPDALLELAEARFWQALQCRPNDASALNGIGNVLWLRGELDAAEFYIRRSIERAREEGFAYPYAEEDLRNIQREKAQRARRAAR